MHTDEEIKEEAANVHALVTKGVLNPHQLYLWVKPLLAQARADERRKVRERIDGLEWPKEHVACDYGDHVDKNDILDLLSALE